MDSEERTRGQLGQRIVLILIDKLLIGALLGAAGLLLNWKINLEIERYRHELTRDLDRASVQESLMTEINRRRIDKMSELWTVMGDVEFAEEQLRASGQAKGECPAPAQMKKLEQLTEAARRFDQELERTRFWLGEELYRRHKVHALALFNYGMVKGTNSNPTECGDQSAVDGSRLNVDDVARMLRDGTLAICDAPLAQK